jgi:hypothetical protein
VLTLRGGKQLKASRKYVDQLLRSLVSLTEEALFSSPLSPEADRAAG